MTTSSVDWSRQRGLAKAVNLFRCYGPSTAMGVVASVIEDLYVRTFDRRYGVRTSGLIPLSQTSLDQNKASKGHRYRPVNAWAFKRVMNKLALPKQLRFVDIGCGLGRACLIAADYGFARVRGVDIVQEFCAAARSNAELFCRPGSNRSPIEIRLADAVEYSRQSDDDVVFLFNPVPVEVLREVLANLTGAPAERRAKYIIYSERVIETSRTLPVLKQHERLSEILADSSWGQAFYVFTVNGSTPHVVS